MREGEAIKAMKSMKVSLSLSLSLSTLVPQSTWIVVYLLYLFLRHQFLAEGIHLTLEMTAHYSYPVQRPRATRLVLPTGIRLQRNYFE